MPDDVALGRELATKLNEQFTGKISEIGFSYDTYVELDKMPNHPVAFVSLGAYSRERVARTNFIRTTELRVTSISERRPNENPDWIDEILDSFDSLISFCEGIPLGSRNLMPIRIESEDRFNFDLFHAHARMVNEASLIYRNI